MGTKQRDAAFRMTEKEELLKKIQALINSPEAGEAAAANFLLKKLMRKYEISEADLTCQEEETRYEFKTDKHNPWQKKLLCQIMWAVTDKVESFFYKKRPEIVFVYTTKTKAFEIHFMFEFYKKVFLKDIELMMHAFIQKHKIFSVKPLDEANELVLTPEEEQKMFLMMEGMSEEQCNMHKAIEDKRC